MTRSHLIAACVPVMAIGATLFRPSIPWWAIVVVSTVALLRMSPPLLIVALILFICVRANTLAQLPSAETRPVEAEWVVLKSDPKPDRFGWVAQASLDSATVIVRTAPGGAGRLTQAAAGERLQVTGTLRGRAPETNWAISNRIVGTLTITDVVGSREANWPYRLANVFRAHLVEGAAHLSPDTSALYTGLVFGDDRFQSSADADDFRAAGLGHLLAVSGQNVVFVLALASPALSRIRSLRLRLAGVGSVLMLFGFVTRFEPSVTRALVMAGLVAIATTEGRDTSAARALPAAVLLLLLWDPLLGLSLAFQLSVAATLGLVVLSPRIAGRLPDTIVGETLAATLGAQLAVSPLVVLTFGSISMVAVPANLLAAPAAAFVMMWGLTAGVVAGFGPSVLSYLVHLPTEAAIWWVSGAASTFGRAPVGAFGIGGVVLVTIAMIASSSRLDGARRVGVGLIVVAVLAPVLSTPDVPAGRHEITEQLTLWRSFDGTDLLVVTGPASVEDTIAAIRKMHIGRIDLIVVTSGTRSSGRYVGELARRFEVLDIWAPAGHLTPNARVAPVEGGVVGGFHVHLLASGSVLVEDLSVRAGKVTHNAKSNTSRAARVDAGRTH